MVIFPNCKINLGLNIIGKRMDGFHDLETVFYPVPLKDALEIIQNPGSDSPIEFSQSGITVQGKEADNLCIKAYYLLKKYFPELPSIKMHLHKTIPMGAGLGGGSSDGAFALKLLNKKFQLGLSNEQLIDFALQLGSDCPFFIINKPCFATGRGECLETITLDLSVYSIVIVNPGIYINTAWAFTNITPRITAKSIKEIIQQPIETWKDELINDFEKPVFENHPEIKVIKEKMYDSGAVYASMSGSGSTVYGVFDYKPDLDKVFPAHYFVKQF
ncbi:MAG: 4-(cytidine 5'-diphospho)-2-C-methyl-D-erythritol kinase [Sphingobacteriales bacterium]